MYSRRNSIRIYNVPQNRDGNSINTVLSLFHNELGIRLPYHTIGRVHRVPRRYQNNKPQPIIVRFVRHDDKERILNAFWNSGRRFSFFMREDLTAYRSKLLNDINNHPFVKRASSYDGKIQCILNSGRRLKNIPSMDNFLGQIHLEREGEIHPDD